MIGTIASILLVSFEDPYPFMQTGIGLNKPLGAIVASAVDGKIGTLITWPSLTNAKVFAKQPENGAVRYIQHESTQVGIERYTVNGKSLTGINTIAFPPARTRNGTYRQLKPGTRYLLFANKFDGVESESLKIEWQNSVPLGPNSMIIWGRFPVLFSLEIKNDFDLLTEASMQLTSTDPDVRDDAAEFLSGILRGAITESKPRRTEIITWLHAEFASKLRRIALSTESWDARGYAFFYAAAFGGKAKHGRDWLNFVKTELDRRNADDSNLVLRNFRMRTAYDLLSGYNGMVPYLFEWIKGEREEGDAEIPGVTAAEIDSIREPGGRAYAISGIPATITNKELGMLMERETSELVAKQIARKLASRLKDNSLQPTGSDTLESLQGKVRSRISG